MAFKYYDHENILIEDLKAIYFVMPKVACTSIKSILANHMGLKNFDNSDHFKNIHQMIDFPYANKQEIFDNYNEYFKFGFVRNPWDRVVSAYTNKITNDSNYNNPSFTNGVGVYSFDEKGKNRFHVGMSFEEFVEVIRTTEPINYDGHFRIQHWILTDMKHRYLADFVGKLESLDSDFKYVCEKIGLESSSLPRFNQSKKNMVRFQDYYNDKTKKIIGKLYEQDIDIYRYKFDDRADILALKPLSKRVKPKISVIIPTFNDIRNIDRAISSVLNQDEKAVQLIVVDDFSDDGTYEHLKENWKDKNIEIYRLNKHESSGGARNYGINKASGDYILFLDSDDWYEQNTFSKLLKHASKTSSDIVGFGMFKVKSNYEKIYYHNEEVETKGGIDALSLYSMHKIGSVVCNKLIKRELLEQNNINFTAPYYHEDVLFTAKLLFFCKKYSSINESFYNYYQNPKSIVNTKPTVLHLKSYLKIANDLILFNKRYLDNGVDAKKIALMLLSSHFFNDIIPRIQRFKELNLNNYELIIKKAIKKEITAAPELLSAVFDYVANTHQEINTKNDHIRLLDSRIEEKDLKIKTTISDIKNLQQELSDKENKIEQLKVIENRLNEIEKSLSWKLVKKIYRIKDKYFPFLNKVIKVVKK